jgi:hypothetical protein
VFLLTRAGLVAAVRQSLLTLALAVVIIWTRADRTEDWIDLGLGLANLLTSAAVVATSNNAVHGTATNLARAAARLRKWDAPEALTRLLVILVVAAAACAMAIISGPPTWLSAIGDRLDQKLLAIIIWPSILSIAFVFFAGVARSASIALRT